MSGEIESLKIDKSITVSFHYIMTYNKILNWGYESYKNVKMFKSF